MENGENIRYEMESPNDLGYLHLSETSTDIPMISEWYPKNPIGKPRDFLFCPSRVGDGNLPREVGLARGVQSRPQSSILAWDFPV